MKLFRSLLTALVLSMALTQEASATAGCNGKMWNPISDIDFRNMGQLKVAGFKMMDAPSIGEPPNHTVPPVCFCGDKGLQSGGGLGLTFWVPSYINDMARQAGCIGFLGGINVLPAFMSLSSSQEYSTHKAKQDAVTNMQIHWAYADITQILGKNLFEQCKMSTSAMKISYLSEVDFVWQSDVYSAIMTPQVALLAVSPLLTQMACGAESIANSLGGWQDWGICSWGGARMPMDGQSIGKTSAQETNMDITIKYLARSAMLGTTQRTMGKDVVCSPKTSMMFDPFQDRFQWAYPGMVTTRYNQNMVMWGLFIHDGGQPNMMSLTSQAAQTAGTDANLKVGSANPANTSDASKTSAPPTDSILNTAKQLVASLPKPLNYPTQEAGFMQVWEARECCMMMITVENVIKYIVSTVLSMGADAGYEVAQVLQEMYKLYGAASTAVAIIKNPIGGALNMIGQGITDAVGNGLGAAGKYLGGAVQGIFQSGGGVDGSSGGQSAMGGDGIALIEHEFLKGARHA